MARKKNTGHRKKNKGRKRNPDFDEATVACELAHAVDEDIEESDVEEDDYYDYTVMKVDDERYMVFEDEDQAHEAAVAEVTEMLENEPELFNQDWLMGHIDQKALSDWVYQAVLEDPYAYDIASDDPERFWEEADRWGITIPNEEEREEADASDYADELAEAIAKDRAKEPMAWLEDLYPRDEAVKKAMEVAGINIEDAAREAVETDGWAHFLSRYDGDYGTTRSNFVYYKGSGYGARGRNPAPQVAVQPPTNRKLKAKLLR